MNKSALQAIAIQKALEMSEQEALKVLVFIAGMEAGKDLQPRQIRNPPNADASITEVGA